jgi:hypothetical protein
MTPTVPISWGELIDKITILEIKAEKLSSESARANVQRELAQLTTIASAIDKKPGLADLQRELKRVNEALWRIEDDIREKEAQKSFDDGFIALARSVYRSNDERGRLKREINRVLGSEITEEKQYTSY